MNSKKVNGGSGVKEIARLAKVSIGTVDRVIHNRPGVSEKTRSKIHQIIQKLNYQPNILASRLASKKVFEIAIFIPHVSADTDFWEAPLKGIKRAESEIKNYGIRLHTHFFDLSDKETFVRQGKRILKMKPHGVLLSPSFTREAIKFMEGCKLLSIPVILIDSNLPGSPGLSYIGPNMFYSGYQVAHLIDFGNRNPSKILFLDISRENNDEETERGFRAYFSDRNQNPDIVKINFKKSGSSSLSKNLSATFREHPAIESVFVSNSRVSAVAEFLKKARLDNVLLIGYDILKDNVSHLESGNIDFLICHKPEEQGYRGIMAFVQKLVFNARIDPIQYMPIDIITRENYRFYRM